jgi:hypothetical protein
VPFQIGGRITRKYYPGPSEAALCKSLVREESEALSIGQY